jgi:ribosomal protein S18 acetylase RimI-like enzyme
MIRFAEMKDINQLIRIEQNSFTTDKLSQSNFRHLLTKAHAKTLVADVDDTIQGYATLLFSKATPIARLYSFAVDKPFRRRGVATKLFQAMERYALEYDCISLRLETRRDNLPMQRLVQQNGYKQFGIITAYYEDNMDAFRYEKSLIIRPTRDLMRVPYYKQSLDFTCGPATLMMAMHALNPTLSLDRKTELRIWRESTTIFMTSGHGGCGPYGLALSAYHRGYDVEVYLSQKEPMFLDSVRSTEKKEVIRLVSEDFFEEISALPITVTHAGLSVAALRAKLDEGAIPLVLISYYRLCREKLPHWVVVTGFDNKYVYVHDPLINDKQGKTATDCVNIPILQKDFERMARYGKSAQKAALVLKLRNTC